MKVEKDESIDISEALDFAKKANKNRPSSGGGLIIGKSLDDCNHGDVIVDKNGVPGIVIDREKKLRDIAENDPELNMMKTLMDSSDPTFSKLDPAIEKPPGTEESMQRYLSEHEDVRMKRDEVRAAFAQYDIGGNGILVPAGDPRAKIYAEAIRKVQTGEIVLPTVEEYEKQEREAKERAARMARERIESFRAANEQQPVVVEPKKIEAPPQGETAKPKIERIEEMEEMNMSVEERNQVINSTAPDPMIAAINNQKNENTNDTEAAQESAKKPIDLFAAGEALREAKEPQPPVADATNEKPEEPSVVIEVPAEKAGEFMGSLSPRTKEKVDASNVIKVKFTKDLILPKAVKRISDIDGYRAVAPKNVSAELVPRILLNSGYIGYFKACGALKWSRLAPPVNDDGEFGDMDEAKIIQFCYEQLATTSLGNMSYRKFLENTSTEDIPAMLHAIMGASLPDQQDVILTCRNCNNDFETTYNISELPDYDTMTDDAKAQATRIESAKDIIDDANDIHDQAPVMQKMAYTASSTSTIFVFKHADLASAVDRQPVIEYMVKRYGTAAAILATVTSEVYIKIGDTGTDEDYSLSTDPTVICEELLRLSTEDLDEVKSVVEQIPTIESITYSIPGSRVCPRCSSDLPNLRQDIRMLVFQIALKAHYFV